MTMLVSPINLCHEISNIKKYNIKRYAICAVNLI